MCPRCERFLPLLRHGFLHPEIRAVSSKILLSLTSVSQRGTHFYDLLSNCLCISSWVLSQRGLSLHSAKPTYSHHESIQCTFLLGKMKVCRVWLQNVSLLVFGQSIRSTIGQQHTNLLVGSVVFGGSDGDRGSVATAKCKVVCDQ